MKHKKVFRVLAVALTLALLAVAIPASPVMAVNEIIVIDPTAGPPGTVVNITGSGFIAQIGGTLYIFFGTVFTGKTVVPATPGGVFGTTTTVTFTVPVTANPGTNIVSVQATANYNQAQIISAVANFYVTGTAAITDYGPDDGAVGTEVGFIGQGLIPYEAIIVEYDGDDIEIEGGGNKAGIDGDFEFTILIPESTAGEHTVTIIGEDSEIELEATFTVEPEITFDVSSGAPGDEIEVTGTGYGYRTDLEYVEFDGDDIDYDGDDDSDRNGSFVFTFLVPELEPDDYVLEVEDEDENLAEADFTVTGVPLNSQIEVTPTSGNVGDTITVTGTEFSPDVAITILFNNAAVTPLAPIITGPDGTFSGSFNIPAVTAGSYTVKAEDTEDHSATATVTVVLTEPEMTMTPLTGSVGDTINVSGTDFKADTSISILYGSVAITLAVPITTGPDGSFTGSFNVPQVAGGSYTVTVTDGTNSLTASFVVEAIVIITPTSGKVGAGVGIGGYGFGANRTITILFNNIPVTLLAPVTTGTNGAFSNAQFYIPASPGGAATITVRDGTISKIIGFTVEASSAIADMPPLGSVGQELNISGSGYTIGATVEVFYTSDPVLLASTTVGSNGSFSVDFTIPESAAGEHTITLSIDDVEVEEFTFVMESIAPAPPVPSLPLIGTEFKYDEEEPPIQFDWQDVGDASLPVTYSLEIATDTNFAFVVLEKTGLTESIYTIVEAEKLEPLEEDGDYYWHVNATDSADNTSEWSGTGSFSVLPAGGGWPGWLTWVLIGLGGLVIFILAVWLGRRIAYSSY